LGNSAFKEQSYNQNKGILLTEQICSLLLDAMYSNFFAQARKTFWCLQNWYKKRKKIGTKM